MKLVPLEDRVVIKIIEQEQVTATGIVLPDTAKEKPSKGRVEAVGPGKYSEKGDLIPMPVKSRRSRRLREVLGHRAQA